MITSCSLHTLLEQDKMPETRHYSPHCEEIVSLSTFHRHKQLYYDERLQTWTKSVDPMSSEDDTDAYTVPGAEDADEIDYPAQGSVLFNTVSTVS